MRHRVRTAHGDWNKNGVGHDRDRSTRNGCHPSGQGAQPRGGLAVANCEGPRPGLLIYHPSSPNDVRHFTSMRGLRASRCGFMSVTTALCGSVRFRFRPAVWRLCRTLAPRSLEPDRFSATTILRVYRNLPRGCRAIVAGRPSGAEQNGHAGPTRSWTALPPRRGHSGVVPHRA